MYIYMYILIFILCPTSSPLSAHFILKSNSFLPLPDRQKNRQSTGKEARKEKKTATEQPQTEGDD